MYEFQVVGVNGAGYGPPSNVVDAMPSTTPQAPGLTATPGDGGVNLSWTTPPDGGAPIQRYVVQYRPGGTTDWKTTTGSGTEPTSTIVGLTNGTMFEFRVAALNVNGLGAYSGIIPATPEASTGPTSTTTTTSPSFLPATGSEIWPVTVIAVLLIVVGAAMVAIRRFLRT